MERSVLLKNTIDDVDTRRVTYQDLMVHYKTVDDLSESTITFLNATGTCVSIIGLSTTNPVFMIIGVATTGVGGIFGAVKRGLNIQQKYESVKTTYNQLSDLSRESKIILARNHLSSDDKQALLSDISHKLSLIEDSSLPVKAHKIV